jgi:FAD/FMN-containing dehydrogenase
LLETLMEADEPLILNGILSQSPTQFASLWAVREGLTEAIGKEGKAYKYDFSLPLATFDDVLNTVRKRCDEAGLIKDGLVRGVVGFGHVGDGKYRSQA